MKKMYQTEWQGIKFNEFYALSENQLADSDFYNSFYKEFFNKYNDYKELNSNWIKQKETIADFIIREFLKENKQKKIFSIGCGIGIIEKKIFEEGYKNIEIQEVSHDSLLWIKKIIPQKQIHIGFLNEITPGDKYDIIYMVAVDYVFEQKEYTDFLKQIKRYLSNNGSIVVISASFYNYSLVNEIKSILSYLIKILINKKKSKQFWGYSRAARDYRNALKKSGYNQLSEGFINKQIYYIKGKNNV